MRVELTIAGQRFSIENRYAAGHVLNENEAAALNQVFRENIRNNLAGRNGELTQELVDKYAAEYQFGVRTTTSRRRTADPVEKTALSMAKAKIVEAIRANPRLNLTDFSAARLKELSVKFLEKHPELYDVAREAVSQARAVADDTLEEIGLGA